MISTSNFKVIMEKVMPRLKKVLEKAKGKMGQSSEVLPILLNLADDICCLDLLWPGHRQFKTRIIFSWKRDCWRKKVRVLQKS